MRKTALIAIPTMLDRIGFNSTRIYITGVNLLTFTDFTGYDPEARDDSGGWDAGQAFYSAPPARTVSLGFTINF